MAVSINIDGQAYTFPDWLSESTGEQMLDTLKGILEAAKVDSKVADKVAKSSGQVLKEIKDQGKEDKVTADEQKKRDEKLIKASEEAGRDFKEIKQSLEQYKLDQAYNKSFFGGLVNAFESEGENVGKAIFKFGGMIFKAGSYVAGTLVGYATYIGNTMLGAGDSLNELAATGVGFNTTFQGFSDSAGLGVSALSGLTGGFKQSAALIGQYANVVAVGGIGRFASQMEYAAAVSQDLGMAMEDSMEQFGDAIANRQKLLNIGNVSQSRMNSQVQMTIKSQMAYATALGVSTEELRAFVDSLIQDNGLLTASLLQFSDTVRSDVVAGIETFASGMAAMGGKAGQDIAAAFLEAGSAGAIGMSESAIGFATALPSLAGPMNEFTEAMRNGTLTQKQAQEMTTTVTKSLGNLSASEKQRIFLMARTGDQAAQTMANAITQFEQSEEKIDEINNMFGQKFDMDAVQTGTNRFNKIITQVSGGFSNAFYSLFANPEVAGALEDGMKEIFGIFGIGMDEIGGKAMDSAKMVEQFIPAIKSFVSTVVDVAKDIAGFFAQFQTDDGFDFGAMFEGIMDKAKGALFSAIGLFVKAWIGLTIATYVAKTYMIPAMKGFASQFMGSAMEFGQNMFAKYGPVVKGLAINALNYSKNMFAKYGPIVKNVAMNAMNYTKNMFAQGATAGKNILNNAIQFAKANFPMAQAKGIASKISGYASVFGQAIFSKSKDVASKVASMASGFMSKIMAGGAPNAVGKMASSAGGMLGGLKDKAAGMMPAGLKDKAGGIGKKLSGMMGGDSKAADKMTMPMGKSGGFLGSIANAVKKFGDNKVLKGAAAIALLGASVGLAGVGLKQFNEVDFAAIIKGTIALGGLAALANVLGKGSTAMIKGAAAVAILGASVIPLAFGLNIMKGVGFETVAVLAGSLISIGLAGAILGPILPILLPGAVAIAALGASIIPLAFALNMMKDVGIETVGVLAGSLITLGVAAASMGFALPFILLGSIAIAALGVALIPMAIGAMIFGKAMGPLAEGLKAIADLPMLDVVGSLLALGGTMTMLILAIPGMILSGIALAALGVALMPLGIFGSMANAGLEGLAEKLALLGGVNYANLLLAAPALLSLGAGMMALSAGGLISGLLDGLGKLFGSESPFDKLAKIGDSAKDINKMADTMKNMGGTLATFEDALSSLNAEAIARKFLMIGASIDKMRMSVENLGAGSIAKLMLLKAFAPTPVQAPAPQQTDGMAGSLARIGSTPISPDQVPTTSMVGPEIPAGPVKPAKPTILDEMKDGAKQVGMEAGEAVDMLLAEIRDLQKENNRLLKKETKAISDLDI